MSDIEEFVIVDTPPPGQKISEGEEEKPPQETSPSPEELTLPDSEQKVEESSPAMETEPKPQEDVTPVQEDKEEVKEEGQQQQPEETPAEETKTKEGSPVAEEKKEEEAPASKEDDKAVKKKEEEGKQEQEEEIQPPAQQDGENVPQNTEEKEDTEKGTPGQKEEDAGKSSEEPEKPAQPAEQEAPNVKPRAPLAISGKQIKQLLTGTEMLKAKKGNKVFPRMYSITGDLVRLVWNSKRKALAKSQIPLSQIDDVLPGRQTPSFKLYQGTHEEDFCFSVLYREGGVQKTLNLIAHSAEEANLWVNGLLALTGNGVTENTEEVRKKWLRTLFDEADANGDGTLDLKEVLKMMKRLNLGISQKTLKKKFKEADSDGNGDNKLDFGEFCTLFSEFSERPELRVLFNLYACSEDGSFMTVGDLLNFMVSEQEVEDATVEYCQSVIERFEPSEAGQRNLLTLDGFAQFLLSDENDIFKREHQQVYQDMTQPLAHYFISSSHNTYLLEDQLSGPSSVDAYIRALKRGCRCVELDCWDGEDNEPIIYHGHTLTSKILFKDVIKAVKENAFEVSPYPVILSIENHCGVAQQNVIADYMTDILGEMLYKVPRNEDLGKLPSPHELKHKVLVKAKKLPKEHEDKENDEGEVSDEDEGAEIDNEEVEKAKVAAKKPSDNPDEIPDGPEEPKSLTQQPEVRKIIRDRKSTKRRKGGSEQKPAAKRKLSSKLSKCVNYIQSVHFKGFEESLSVPFYHMSSFSESSAFKHSETSAAHYIEYNKVHLSRTYPAGVRVDSSNYEPIDLWNCGCQIVALNYQTSGKPMDYNIGKFQQNGGCGYILKPDIMREDFSHFNHKDKDSAHGITPKLVSIRIISAQRLPKPEGGNKDGEVIDPYILVNFTGVPDDKSEFKTKVVDDNGFNPVWNEKVTQLVTFSELALIRFKVMDYDFMSQDDFIGQYTLPISSMNTGYRRIKLYTTEGEVIEGATLFVEVRKEDYVGPTPRSKEKPRTIPTKKARQYHPMKPVSFPALDQIFKDAKLTIHHSTDIREDYKFCLLVFKECCGKGSVYDCMEALITKAHSARVQLKLVARETSCSRDVKIYQIEVAGENDTTHKTGLTGALSGIMAAFNNLNGVINSLLNIAETIANELEDHYRTALEQKDNFFSSLSGVQPKKVQPLRAVYSSNVRCLRNEAIELRAALDESIKVLQKISQNAGKFGIPITTPPKAPSPPSQEEEPPKGNGAEQQVTDTPTEQKEGGEEPKEEGKEKAEQPKTEDTSKEEISAC